MKLILKNGLKLIFQQKSYTVALFAVTLLLCLIFVGLFGFSGFLLQQKNGIAKAGHQANSVFNLNSTQIKSGNDNGTEIGLLVTDTDSGDPYIWNSGADANPNFLKLFSTIEYIAWGDGQESNFADLQSPALAKVAINFSDDRTIVDANGTYQIVPWESFIQPDDADLKFQDGSEGLSSIKVNDATQLSEQATENEPAISDNAQNYYKDEYKALTSSISENQTWTSDAVTRDGSSDGELPAAAQNFGLYYRNVNTPVLLQGRIPNRPDEIDISAPYAKANKLKSDANYLTDGNSNNNSILAIRGVNFHIVGLATTPKYFYPQISPTNLSPQASKECLVFTQLDFYQRAFGAFFQVNNSDRAIDIQIQVRSGNTNQFLSLLQQRWDTELNNSSANNTISTSFSYFNVNDPNYIFHNRYDFINSLSNIIRILSYVFVLTILGVILLAALVIVNQKLKNNIERIGILKAMGYSRNVIAQSYIVSTTIVTLLAAILGVALGIVLWGSLVAGLSQFFNFSTINPFDLNLYTQILASYWWLLIIGIVLPTLTVAAITYFYAYYKIGKPIISLIYKGGD